MAKRPKWYGKTSKPYVGYLSDKFGISEHIEDAGENDLFFPCVSMRKIDFINICGDNLPHAKKSTALWEYYPRHGEKFWCTLMGSNNGEDIHLVTDDFKYVYIFHIAMQTTYHLGRLYKCDFSDYVLRKLKKVR